MTEKLIASAYPHKSFFVEMFTRDISLEACMLDLIDNSIDGLIRTRNLDVGRGLLEPPPKERPGGLPIVKLEVTDRSVVITDNCGGIPFRDAKDEVFNFGHSPAYHRAHKNVGLGVFGIGLKRALFKIGTDFEMTSKTVDDAFSMVVDLNEWMSRDRLEDWTFPLVRGEKAKSKRTAGTTIKITGLREETRAAINDGRFTSRLTTDVGRAFALLLDRFVIVQLGRREVKPLQIPLGGSEEVTPASKELTYDGVTVNLFAGLAKRDANNEWPADPAGWYVACNGRLVVTADKTDLTGWGAGLPEFHTGKYRGFVGLALFSSDDPLKIPWNTRKSGLNRESLVLQSARHEMIAVTRPIISFLNKMYPTDAPDVPEQRAIADRMRYLDVRNLATRGSQTDFAVRPQKQREEKSTVRVQYNAEKAEIEKVRKHLRRPGMTSSAIGEFTFKEYLRSNRLA